MEWQSVGRKLFNVTLSSNAIFQYDGLLEPKVTNTTYLYDSFQNVIEKSELGYIDVEGDERVTRTMYALNPSTWVLRKPAEIIILDGDELITQTRIYYDDLGLGGVQEGLLTKKEEGFGPLTNFYSYDSFGNLISMSDANGNKHTYFYDPTHVFKVAESNPLGHMMRYEYDLGTGNVLSVETNGIATHYTYDQFGRITSEVLPYDSLHSPTAQYSYEFDGVAPESITKTSKIAGNNSAEVTYYYDGLARLAQTSQLQRGQWISQNIFYVDGKVSQMNRPYFSPNNSFLLNTEIMTTYSWDGLGRILNVTNPDGSLKEVEYFLNNVSDIDEKGNMHKYMLDGLGRIIQVHEFNVNDLGGGEEYVTRYSYDELDNLIEILDSAGNQFIFSYDELSRKIHMQDPDLGNWTYVYDNLGNLIEQNDSIGNSIELSYDALNRVIEKNSEEIQTAFAYDLGKVGTLSEVNFSNTRYVYEYDDRLRMIESVLYVEGIPYATNYSYNSRNNLVLVDGNSKLQYAYDPSGGISRVFNYANLSYTSFGGINTIDYANGVGTNYSYDTRSRITSIDSGEIQNIAYAYDPVGNILSINHSGRIHSLMYDSLDRLISANIEGEQYDYSYSSTGNILKLVDGNVAKKFVYSGNAHAPTQISEGSIGVDIYLPSSLDTESKMRVVEFFVRSDRNQSLNANWSVDFGDEIVSGNESISLSDPVLVFVSKNYSEGGEYVVNISAQGFNSSDTQVLRTQFGIQAINLTVAYSNASQYVFDFFTGSNINETISLTWECLDVSSIVSAEISNQEDLYTFFYYNFTTPGKKEVECTVFGEGNQSISLIVDLKTLEAFNYDVLYRNISSQIVSLKINNSWHDAQTNFTLLGVDMSSSELNLSSGDEMLAFIELNSSSDGRYNVSGQFSDLDEQFLGVDQLNSVEILDYDRVNLNTTQLYVFNVKNLWYPREVDWSIEDLSGKVNLSTDEDVLVFVERNYSQSDKQVYVSARSQSVNASIFDIFYVRPLKLDDFVVLSEGQSSVSELIVSSQTPRSFSWSLDSGEEVVSGSGNVSGSVFVFVETNYSSEGVWKTFALVNSSLLNDNSSGVVMS